MFRQAKQHPDVVSTPAHYISAQPLPRAAERALGERPMPAPALGTFSAPGPLQSPLGTEPLGTELEKGSDL